MKKEDTLRNFWDFFFYKTILPFFAPVDYKNDELNGACRYFKIVRECSGG